MGASEYMQILGEKAMFNAVGLEVKMPFGR
ncbi:protein of unknown function [Vibrio tapetis subsp. tapetis]|uniref:Uncharacterized protein n=2 Tax=Vibrio tapetis TaxID=52443 RepID=A0A2N8Z972_9VIBR|nr:protein of unknown function [Vibrio tapetis subsp. tapetis]